MSDIQATATPTTAQTKASEDWIFREGAQEAYSIFRGNQREITIPHWEELSKETVDLYCFLWSQGWRGALA